MYCAAVTGSTCLRKRGDGEVMNARQQSPVAPLGSVGLVARCASPVKFPRRTEPARLHAQQRLLDVGWRTGPANRPARRDVTGPQCIIQPVTMASSASSREAVLDGSSGGVTSNFASGKISAKSFARSDATK